MKACGPVVITGGSGMIGAPLVRRCIADGADVHVFTRSWRPPLRLAGFGDRLQLHVIDWSDARALRELFNAIAPRTVFHLAGVRLTAQAQRSDYLSSAVSLTVQLLDALADRPEAALIFASSGAVYGDRERVPETAAVQPNSWLGAAKAMTELLIGAEARLCGRPLVALRLFTPFGPDDDPDRLIVGAIRAAQAEQLFPISAGMQTRDYVYIDDVVDAFVRAARLRPDEPEIMNIGSGESRSVRAVVEAVLGRLGRADLARFGTRPSRPGDIERMQADIRYARERLDWLPRLAFGDGVDRTIAALDSAAPAPRAARELERISVS